MQIWMDILSALQAEQGRGGARVRPTRIQSAANLPHDRFWGHVDELATRGLLSREPLGLTAEGALFLRQSHDVQDFMRRFGLDESPAPRPARLEPLALAPHGAHADLKDARDAPFL